MAVVLFTGVPKAGKTLMAVTRLLVELKKDAERPIFCDIKGLNIEGVQSAPDDWTTCPDGSLIIYDEVQYREPYRRNRGATKYQYILDLTTHAHRGIDIWLITQSPKFLHSDVTEVVGEHYHLTRPNNSKFSKFIRWGACEHSPNGTTAKREYEAKGIVRHNKEVFDLYNAVQVDDDIAHHKKFAPSIGMVVQVGLFVLIIAFLIYRFATRDNGDLTPPTSNPQPTTQVDQVNNPFNAPQDSSESELQRVAFVISSSVGCVAKNSQGVPIAMTHSDCMQYSDNPSMISPSLVKKSEIKQGFHHGNLPPIDLTNTTNSSELEATSKQATQDNKNDALSAPSSLL